MSCVHTATSVDGIAEDYLDAAAAHNPAMATYIGVLGHDDRLPAYDPDWFEQRSQLRRRTLEALAGAAPHGANDKITVAALRDQLEVAEALRAIGDEESCVRNIESPVQTVRDVFDLMPTETTHDWETIARRLAAVPASLAGYRASLELARTRRLVRPRRQIEAALEQCEPNVGPDGFFATLARAATPADGMPLPDALRADLERGAQQASAAYEELAGYLRERLLPHAGDADAVGREHYPLYLRSFTGTSVDLDETYAWGQEELARIVADMRRTAERIRPGASIADALQVLDGDSSRKLSGTAALQRWMQERSDAAIAALADAQFDIPDPIRRLECRIAPTHAGGIYYTGPSEDLVTRPGRMWWSVPRGTTEFRTWRELTTVFHEGVPGHHLQVGQTVYRRDLLNRWRRLGCWVSGYGEGWALYAERLMAELGFLDDPADYLGMLDAQAMRAARVVIDIGVHCELPAPPEAGGGTWTYEKAFDFFTSYVHLDEASRRFEVTRYFGWPGQAPSYKLGERYWLQLREAARAQQGAAFSLRDFHARALNVGAVGLDVLGAALVGDSGAGSSR